MHKRYYIVLTEPFIICNKNYHTHEKLLNSFKNISNCHFQVILLPWNKGKL